MKHFLFSLLVLFCSLTGMAQERISGRVVDSLSRQPLGKVAVTVSVGAKPTQSVVSNERGEFSIALPEYAGDSLQLEFNLVGHAKKQLVLAQRSSMGEIGLLPVAEALSEASATAKASQLIRIDPEKLSYNVAADGLAKAENVLDMLKRVPLVEVRDNEYILVNGMAAIVTINNREHPMLQNSPATYLQSLPATAVAKVDVYTTPSVRFNSSVRINLVIQEPPRNTYSGMAMLSVSQQGATNFNGSYGISRGKLASQLMLGGGALIQQKSESYGFRESYSNGTTSSYSRTGKQVWSIPYSASYIGSYELSKQSLVFLSLSAMGNEPLSPSGDQGSYTTTAANGSVLNSYTIDNEIELRLPSYALKANYQYNFKANPDRMFTFSYSGNFRNQHTESVNRYEGVVNYTDSREDRDASYRGGDHTLQLDYVHPFTKLGKLESGLKYIRRNNTTSSELYRYNAYDVPVYDSLLSSSIAHDENVGIAYLSYSVTLGKYFLTAGGRAEYSDVTVSKASAEPFSRDFFRPVPMASITRMVGTMSKVSLSYSMSSQKPDIQQLNPAVDKRAANIYFMGNPDLKSMVSHKLSLGFNTAIHTLSINNTISYTRSVNGITSYNYLTPLDEMIITYNNAEQGRHLVFYTYESVPLLRGVTLRVNGSLGYSRIRNSQTDSITDGWPYGFMLSLEYRPTSKWIFLANGGYSAGSVNMQTVRKGSFTNMFSAMFTLNRHFNFGLSVQSPLTPVSKTFSQTFGDNFYSESNSKRNSFTARISVSYRFWGDVRVKQNRRNIINDDVYSGGGVAP